MNIPLPNVITKPDASAHPYPFQIAQQTLEFMQCALFYNIISDISSGEHVKHPGNILKIKDIFLQRGIEEGVWESAWGYLEKYKIYFEKYIYQNVLIAMNSHWDWYVRKLSEFIYNSRQYVPSPQLNPKQERDLKRIGFMSIEIQISILELATGIKFGLARNNIDNLREMSYVRNLCLHNRMEVDNIYKNKSILNNIEVDDLRIIDDKELLTWHDSFNESVRITCTQVAMKYLESPLFK
jgi:hypothetical protein